MNNSEPYIEVRDLVADYEGVKAVDGISFSVRRGEHLTLLGPSGCGKTTTLRVLAGLQPASSGEIRVGGEVFFSSRQGINLPAEKRRLAMVFQSYAIWPHMSVAGNVAYGLRLRGAKRATCAEQVRKALEMVGMDAFAERNASELSGGQQQRIALARALVVQPRVLLLDEPLSNLDARLRVRMRSELQALQERTGVTSVYVTHDQEEAFAFSDRIIVMQKGSIAQEGSPREIFETPRTEFVADFVGAANVITGNVIDRDPIGKRVTLRLADGSLIRANTLAREHGDAVSAAIRPAHIALSRTKKAQCNSLNVDVCGRVFLGDSMEYVLQLGDMTLLARRSSEEIFDVGERIWAEFPEERCIILE